METHRRLLEECQPSRLGSGPTGGGENVVEQGVAAAAGDLVGHPGGNRALERPLISHAERSRTTLNGSGCSAASAARSVSSPRWSRDLAVPAGIPRISAASVRGWSR